jgi:hypothetical protein
MSFSEGASVLQDERSDIDLVKKKEVVGTPPRNPCLSRQTPTTGPAQRRRRVHQRIYYRLTNCSG